MIRKILVIGLLCFIVTALSAQAGEWKTYIDPQGRFEFSYPQEFGTPAPDIRVDMPGGDKGQMLKFPEFSYGLRGGKIILEGCLVIRSGRTWVGAQALGGLYDPIIAGSFISAFPIKIKDKMQSLAENISINNFCSELAKPEHIKASDPVFQDISPEIKQVVIGVDSMSNLNPKVISCTASSNTVVFHKQAVFQSGEVTSLRQIYGAVRFLKWPFSSVQLIRISADPPSKEMLDTMLRIVNSFKVY